MALYSQIPFLKIKCTENAKSTIKNTLKSAKKKKKIQRKIPRRKKMEGEKERYYEDPESSNVCKFLCQDKNMKKRNIAKILNKKKRI